MTYFEPERAEGPAVPLAGPPEPGGPSDLRHYAGTLRRRWKWVALGVLVGLLAGIASAVLQKDVQDPTTYWKATNTLLLTDPAIGATGGTNLPQTAFFLRSADVTNAIAADLAVTPQLVNEQVGALAHPDLQTIDVTAVATDPDRAVTLADTAARDLSSFVASEEQTQYNQKRDALLQKIEQLGSRQTELQSAIVSDPATADAAQAELSSVSADYESAVRDLQALAEQGEPGGGFVTLQSATPVQINPSAYQKRIQANRDDRGGGSSTAIGGDQNAPSNESDLSGTTPVSKATRIAIGFGAGLVLGLITAFVVEAWDDRLRRSERAEGVTGFPVLAEIPVLSPAQRKSSVVPAVDAAGSRTAERYRSLRTSILFLLHQQVHDRDRVDASGNRAGRTPVILVTSPNAGEGKTTTVANFAAALGDNGARTLVVDCDYRKPAIAGYLQPIPELDHLDQPARTRLDGVYFIPAPRIIANPGEPRPRTNGTDPAARSVARTREVIQALEQRINAWRDQFDIVILDTPPLLLTNDAADLLPSADGVMLVLRAGQTRSGQAERASNLLRRFGANVLGVVLNGTSARDTGDAYGYGYMTYYVEAPSDPPTGTDDGSGTEVKVTPAPLPPPTDLPAGNGNGTDDGTGTGTGPDGTNGLASGARPAGPGSGSPQAT